MKKKYINPRMDVFAMTTCQSILTGSSLVNTIDGDGTGLILGTGDEVETPLSRGILPEDFLFAEQLHMVTFSAKQTSIKAGVPYIIKWTSGTGITSPAFSNVTIDYSLESVDTDEIGFMGTYSKITLEGGDNEVLFMGTDNKLYWPTSDVTLNANRCAFVLDGLTAADVAAARSIELDFGDGNTTSISEVTNGTPETGSVWFTISGYKLQGAPTSKGIYIHNGKKYIKK